MPFVISVKHSLIYRKNQGQSRIITDLIITDINGFYDLCEHHLGCKLYAKMQSRGPVPGSAN